MARIAIACTLGLAGCLTVAPPGFVRNGHHGFYRGWCDVNTLNAPALYFERVKSLPYSDERVRSYPPAHWRTPGPRLALAGHDMFPPPAAVPPPGADHRLPAAAPQVVSPAPLIDEPELLPPPPAP